MRGLTLEEQATNYETMRHIEKVRFFLNRFIRALLSRGEEHDQSKLEPPEVALFTEYTPKLAASTYESEEYKGLLKALSVALDHHYAHNRHHPEFHKDGGVGGMNLVDLVEMFCDWKAATMRHQSGDLRKSIEINARRFGLSAQLVRILENTVDLVEEKE